MSDATSLEAVTMRKVLWRTIPLILLCYFCAIMDRANVSFAAARMNQALGFSLSVYGLGGSMFFLGYALFEIPSNLLAQRTGARAWLTRIMVTWGLLSAAMMLVRTPLQFYALRFLLGVAEAGFYPLVITYFARWYPGRWRSRAVSRFYVATPLAALVMGLVSPPLLDLDGTAGLAGWQWLFLAQGLPTVLVGALVLFTLPERPESVRWLSPDERAWLDRALAREAAQIGEPAGHNPFVVLTNPAMLMMGLCGGLLIGVTNAFITSAPLIIGERTGFDVHQVGYLIAVGGILGAVVMILAGEQSDRGGDRWLNALLLVLVMGAGLVGLALAGGVAGASLAYLAYAASVFSIAMLTSSGWADFIHPRELAVGSAAINSLSQLCAFAFTWGWGVVRDASGSYVAGLLVFGALCFVNAALIGLIRRRVLVIRARELPESALVAVA